MQENLNIAQLIEKNSLTRLSKDYESKLLNKIKNYLLQAFTVF